MDIFIHDTHISLCKTNELKEAELYENSWDFSHTSTPLLPDEFEENVLLHYPSVTFVQQFVRETVKQKHANLQHCVIVVNELSPYKKAVKSLFYTLKAAGGLVVNQDKYLLIYRLGKWDLPKGKAEKGETIATTAIREVEEECNVKVALQDFICSTWHYYSQKGKPMLKKTKWYTMQCLDDSDLQPQTIEAIERVEWLDKIQLKSALANTYNSILFVFQSYFAL